MMTEVRGVVGRLRDSHHRIAQMYAMGMTDAQIRRLTGLTQHRLTVYRNDPAFQNLVSEKIKKSEDKFEDQIDLTTELMTHNRTVGEMIIAEAFQQHMDGEREISLTVVDKIVQGRMDRTGFGKTSKIEHKHDFAMRLENAIQRTEKTIEGRTIEGQIVHASPKPASQPSGVSVPHSIADSKSSSHNAGTGHVESAKAQEKALVARVSPEPTNYIQRRRLA